MAAKEVVAKGRRRSFFSRGDRAERAERADAEGPPACTKPLPSSPLLRRLSNFLRSRPSTASMGPRGPGQGHHFAAVELPHPTYCDTCDEVVWGLLGVLCEHCQYTCHQHCQAGVALDCVGASAKKALKLDGVGNEVLAARASRRGKHPPVKLAPTASLLSYLQPEELRRKLVEYNQQTTHQHMELMVWTARMVFEYFLVVFHCCLRSHVCLVLALASYSV